MTPEALTEHGFREYAPNHQLDERFEKAWCYAERVSAGRLYFVHVRFWRHSRYSTPDNEVPDGWDTWRSSPTPSATRSMSLCCGWTICGRAGGRVVRRGVVSAAMPTV